MRIPFLIFMIVLCGCAGGPDPEAVLARARAVAVPTAEAAVEVCVDLATRELAKQTTEYDVIETAKRWQIECVAKVKAGYLVAATAYNAALHTLAAYRAGTATAQEATDAVGAALQAIQAFADVTLELGIPIMETDHPFSGEAPIPTDDADGGI